MPSIFPTHPTKLSTKKKKGKRILPCLTLTLLVHTPDQFGCISSTQILYYEFMDRGTFKIGMCLFSL